MKILLIQPTGDKYGHYGLYFCKVAQELAKLGHDVTIYTNKLDTKKFIDQEPLFVVLEYKKGKHPFENYELNKVSRPFAYWFNYFRLSFVITATGLKFAKSDKFDVVYISDAEFLMASTALVLYSNVRRPILMQVNASNFSFKEYSGSVVKKVYKAIQAYMFGKAVKKYIDGISVLGDWHIPRLRAQLKLSEDYKIYKIPDGATQLANLEPKPLAREKLGINHDVDLLLFLGILRIDKGLEVLAEAVQKLHRSGESFKLIVAGHPYDYSSRQIENLFWVDGQFKDRIRLDLNYIADENLSKYYTSADALILPYNSKYKGSTGPLMKGACTYGLPLILSDQGEMGSLARKHDLGYLFETENSDSLVDAIKAFLSSSINERIKKTKNAFELGQLNSWGHVAGAFESSLVSICDKNKNNEE